MSLFNFNNVVTDDYKNTEIKLPKSVYDPILDMLNKTYTNKNAMYGNSFSDSITRFGYVAALTRMFDKISRIISVSKLDNKDVKYESLSDSVLDLANYSMMFHAAVDNSAYRDVVTKVSFVVNRLEVIQEAYSSNKMLIDLLETHFNFLCDAVNNNDGKVIRNITILLASYCLILYVKLNNIQ